MAVMHNPVFMHLIMPLRQQCIVLCMFTNSSQKGISIGFQHLLFMSVVFFLFVHHASFQGLYLSEVIANLLQSCKLQCRASYTIMQNGTLSVNSSHAILNVRVPKHSLFTQALRTYSVPESCSFCSLKATHNQNIHH